MAGVVHGPKKQASNWVGQFESSHYAKTKVMIYVIIREPTERFHKCTEWNVKAVWCLFP